MRVKYIKDEKLNSDKSLSFHNYGFLIDANKTRYYKQGRAYYSFLFFHSPIYIRLNNRIEHIKKEGFVLLPPFTHREYGNKNDEFSYSVINIGGSLVNKLSTSHNIPLNTIVPINCSSLFKKYISLFENELLYNSKESHIILENFAKNFLIELSREINSKESLIHPKARIVIALINDAISNNKIYTLEELANKVSISKNYLCSIFKKATNQSIHSYIRTQKIEQAKDLLLDESLSICEISQLLNFTDQNYFTRIFKKSTLKTPTEFREEAKSAFSKQRLYI